MRPSNSLENPGDKSGHEQAALVSRNFLFDFWTGRAWPMHRTVETAYAAEHVIETCRSLFTVNQLTTEALYNTAQRQQELAFHLARTTLDACSLKLSGDRAQQSNAPWKRMMAGYAETYKAGLEVTQATTDAAFKALQHAPAMLISRRNDGASAS
ncbi:hypothetical protein [Teichococcus vastitatis]|uniref:Phasin protein n=1 Tax=Teichococcus vastitatis TaxID=2307076 RepID=A0ABS9W8J4_9PROT|nr:hypothetical protein [Pseudoroseomonas vastitatis]MCI0755614.1 hypothetical protein [Pseudoroseomonas vastitatis]